MTAQPELAPATDLDWLIALLARNFPIYHSLRRKRVAREIVERFEAHIMTAADDVLNAVAANGYVLCREGDHPEGTPRRWVPVGEEHA